MTDELIITVNDVIAAPGCIRGLKRCYPQWGFSREDFVRFIREGVPLSEIEHIEDINIKNAIAAARRRVEGER